MNGLYVICAKIKLALALHANYAKKRYVTSAISNKLNVKHVGIITVTIAWR